MGATDICCSAGKASIISTSTSLRNQANADSPRQASGGSRQAAATPSPSITAILVPHNGVAHRKGSR